MSAQEVAQDIGWDLVERCGGGEHGAYLVTRHGERAILKLASNAMVFASIRNGAELADRARANGQLVPRMLAVEEWGDAGYTLQDFVDGEVPARFTLELAQRMIELLGTHEGVAASWPTDRPNGFGEWWTWSDTIANSPVHIKALAHEAADAREKLRGIDLPRTDVVHSDYHHKNLLVRADEVIAVIDWDGAHVGDRWYDAFLLMWWAQAARNDFDPKIAAWLRPTVEAAIPNERLAWYATEIACGQLEFFQRVHPGEPAEWIHESVQTYMAPYWR